MPHRRTCFGTWKRWNLATQNRESSHWKKHGAIPDPCVNPSNGQNKLPPKCMCPCWNSKSRIPVAWPTKMQTYFNTFTCFVFVWARQTKSFDWLQTRLNRWPCPLENARALQNKLANHWSFLGTTKHSLLFPWRSHHFAHQNCQASRTSDLRTFP